MSGREQRLELSPRPASAAVARRFVARALSAADPEAREIGVLLVSELVTNAVLYAQGRITVQVRSRGAAMRVTVTDADHHSVHPRHVGPEATSGRGLALVDELSTSWGVDLRPDDGKEVWFEVPGA